MSHKVDLGRKLKDLLGMPQAVSGDDTDYPTLHIDDHPDMGLLDMPDQGKATIHYKVKRREATEKDDGSGKKCKRCSVSLQVHHLEHDKKEPKRKNNNDEARASAKNYFDNLK